MTRAWCQREPHFKINGAGVTVDIGVFGEATAVAAAIVSSTDIEVHYATGATFVDDTDPADDGWHAEGWNILPVADATLTGNKIRVRARVNANNDPATHRPFLTNVTLDPDNNSSQAVASGSTGSWTGFATVTV